MFLVLFLVTLRHTVSSYAFHINMSFVRHTVKDLSFKCQIRINILENVGLTMLMSVGIQMVPHSSLYERDLAQMRVLSLDRRGISYVHRKR